MTEAVDVVIVGGGIAGCSLAGELAPHARLVVLEQEDHLGRHATGRSAALFSETYGNDVVRRLSKASRGFFEAPPPGFAEQPLLRRRGTLYVAARDRLARLEALRRAVEPLFPHVRVESGAEICARVPILRPNMVHAGLLDPDSSDIDVDALHQGYARQARAHGGAVLTGTPVSRIARRAGLWDVEAAGRRWRAPVLVNAAGAWGDEVARIAGVAPLGLRPCRRTAVLIAAPSGIEIDGWPLVTDVDEQIYFKPDAGAILVSPADEEESVPCDAQPDEWDVAVAMDRFAGLTSHAVSRVLHRWAGLRTFAADGTPAIGFDPDASGFFWLVGQGGYGVQTAPAISKLAAGLIATPAGATPPIEGDIRQLAPDRFR